MKIAIHHRPGSFSERWIDYCNINNLNYILINCFDDSIMEILKKEEITHLLWHMTHSSFKDLQVFPYVLNSAEKIGIKTFPDFNTRWHFDDKIAQKYLLEAIDAPLVKSHVFYTKEKASNFLRQSTLPLVGKLKRGAGASNVFLLNNENEVRSHIDKMFTSGIISTSKIVENLGQKIRVANKIKNPFELITKTLQFFKKNKTERLLATAEKGYAYFQEFLPENHFDTRVIVIGEIAFAIMRLNRKDDFRASGSGKIDFDYKKIDINLIQISFEVNKKLNMQCVAFDFIYDQNKKPKIVEICFGYSMKAYDECPGFWTPDMHFHERKFNPQHFMIENLLKE